MSTFCWKKLEDLFSGYAYDDEWVYAEVVVEHWMNSEVHSFLLSSLLHV